VSTPVLPESRLDEQYPPREQLCPQHAPPSGTRKRRKRAINLGNLCTSTKMSHHCQATSTETYSHVTYHFIQCTVEYFPTAQQEIPSSSSSSSVLHLDLLHLQNYLPVSKSSCLYVEKILDVCYCPFVSDGLTTCSC
jgi:hypothetical protein